jgi:NADH dehydrogenase
MSNAGKHRILILGGGFGGLYAAKALRHADADVTLLDRRNFHLFQPLLYQVATGSLSPGEIAAPLRGVLQHQRNTRVLMGEAADIDATRREVILKDGDKLPYDSLIVACGTQSAYFGHDEWREWAPSLKSIEEATDIRHKILIAFEAAERTTDPAERTKWLTFVIVGAGATGVELAGALGEIANHTLRNEFRSIRPEEARIIVVDGGQRVLPTYPPDLSTKAERGLLKLCAQVRMGFMVTGVDADGVEIKSTSTGATSRIESYTVIWAAGVSASEFGKKLAQRTGAEADRSGRIKVEPNMTVPGYPDIFIVGDLALATQSDGKALPGVAQVAMQSGAYAAKTIMNRVAGHKDEKPFKYFNKGDLAVIGRGAAIANIFGIHLDGVLAWLVWVFIHLLYIVEFQNRFLIFIQWGFLYLTYNRGARLITGNPAGRQLPHLQS